MANELELAKQVKAGLNETTNKLNAAFEATITTAVSFIKFQNIWQEIKGFDKHKQNNPLKAFVDDPNNDNNNYPLIPGSGGGQ